jgi:N-methylhydantoinase A/oxoprolinase/acetone carboxylase beta subunit
LRTDDNPLESLVLGIDTGGTYTDGVLLEYHARRVLAAHKSLTTKRDFSIGIERVIEGIHIEDPSTIRMVSISTTLATNAIAEGKGKRVALLLIGYDPDLISSFKMEARFATPHFFYFAGGHDLYGREKEELDLPGILARVTKIKDHVDAIAVSTPNTKTAFTRPSPASATCPSCWAISFPPSWVRWNGPRRQRSMPR